MALLVACLILLVPGTIWKGYVVAQLWGWFVVPLGVPDISLAHAVGLSALAGLLAMQMVDQDPDKDDLTRIAEAATFAVFWPAIILGIGAIAHGVAA